MKAVLCKAFGPPETLVIEEVAAPTVGPDEVKIGVRACGVNFPDTLIIENKYQHKPDLPFSPGGEAAGEIIEVGANVTSVKRGDRVIAMAGHGGFAEEMVVPGGNTMAIPDGMGYEMAAGFSLTYGTSLFALQNRANLQPGEKLLILGAAGGVGLSAIEIGKAMGAHIIACASTEEKLEACKEYGADEFINYAKEDLRVRAKEVGGVTGLDVIYDPVGGELSEAAFRAIGWYGRHLVIGFASGDIPRVPWNLALLKQAQIVGVFWGAYRDLFPELNASNMEQLAGWFEDGTLKVPVTQVFPMDRVGDALNTMIERRAIGKVVLTTDLI